MLKIIKIVKILILVLSLLGMGIGGFLHFKGQNSFAVSQAVKPINKEGDPNKNSISMVGSAQGEQNGRF